MKQEVLISVYVINIMLSINSICNAQNLILQQERLHITFKEQFIVTIYYRWNKESLDKTYLTNAQSLHRIDSIIHAKNIRSIDSLYIVGYASPEGATDYNKQLSLRRANTIKRYILEQYPELSEKRIITYAQGENWNEFRRMTHINSNLSLKEQILTTLSDTAINELARQSQIVELDSGKLYSNYLLPWYYCYLRNSTLLFIVDSSVIPIDTICRFDKVIKAKPEIELKFAPTVIAEYQPEPTAKCPVALRTNLLYDLVGAINLGVEMPLGKRKQWSGIIDGAYSHWRSSSNFHALQTLEYGVELRYWLGTASHKKGKNPNWGEMLKGWNTGVYGRYWQCYDVQWIDGYQGDGSWSAGLTAGYAFPVSKQWAFEASLGAGWFSTIEYRHYHQPEYDKGGKIHLMWQQNGSWRGVALTKVRFSLVWLIECKQVGGRK